ncbi:permease [Pseudochelatococcus sp. B33]
MDNLSATRAVAKALRRGFDSSFVFFLVLAVGSGLACWLLRGPETMWQSLVEDADMLSFLLPKLAAAAAVSAMVPILLPREVVARWLGESSGVRGVVIASAAGSVMPGGPITSFPLVAALQAAGTGRQTLIAFLTAWSVLGIQRILVWELPLMGSEFVIVRVLVSFELPLIAAGIALLAIRFADARKGEIAGEDK